VLLFLAYVFVALILVPVMGGIQVANISLNHHWESYSDFPKHCSTDDGCTRITLKNSNRGGDWEPLTILESQKHVVEDHMDDLSLTYSVSDNSKFKSWRTVSVFWGFVDDTAVRFDSCVIDGKEYVTISAIAELRLGKSDFEVNDERLKDLY
jgi:hypothetical protein